MTPHEAQIKTRRGTVVSALLLATVVSTLAGCVLARSDRGDGYGYDRDRDYRHGNYGYRVPDRDYPYRDRARDRDRDRDYDDRDYRRGEYRGDHEGPGIR